MAYNNAHCEREKREEKPTKSIMDQFTENVAFSVISIRICKL